MTDNNMAYAIVFFVFVPFMIMSMFYGGQVVQDFDLQAAPDAQRVVEFDVSSNWSDQGTLSDNMLTDGDIIYPDSNQQGNWTSFVQDVPRNRIVEVTYDADMREGTGHIFVDAWTDNPNGDAPDDTVTVNLSSGVNTEEVGFSEYNYFRITIQMTEEGGSANQRPAVDRLNVDYEIVEEQLIGVETSTLYTAFYVLILLAIGSLIGGLYSVMRNG